MFLFRRKCTIFLAISALIRMLVLGKNIKRRLIMPRFIRNFLFDHEQQIHDMLVTALCWAVAITYMTIHAVAD